MFPEFGLFILQCLYVILPVYMANMAPVIVKKEFMELAVPIDGGLKWNGKPLFGKNKTYRGIIFGVIFGIGTTYVQHLLQINGMLANLAIVSYDHWIILGALFGLGALLGDLIESFFKRQLSIKPGQRFIPFDQIDFVIGAMILTYPFVELSIPRIGAILIISFFLHITVNHIAFYTGIRSEKW